MLYRPASSLSSFSEAIDRLIKQLYRQLLYLFRRAASITSKPPTLERHDIHSILVLAVPVVTIFFVGEGRRHGVRELCADYLGDGRQFARLADVYQRCSILLLLHRLELDYEKGMGRLGSYALFQAELRLQKSANHGLSGHYHLFVHWQRRRGIVGGTGKRCTIEWGTQRHHGCYYHFKQS